MIRNFYKINPKLAQVLAHNIRWQIMKLLSNDESLYAKSIAKTLRISEQKVHYHLTQLLDAGLLVPSGTRPIKRGRAKLFKPIANQFLLSLLNHENNSTGTTFTNLFSSTFCQKGFFMGKIVVGSAEPHGRYDAISRDGFLTGELCWYLGNHFTIHQDSIPYFITTDVNYEKLRNQKKTNLILIGGHITNTLTAHYNTILKSKFNIYFIENRIASETKEFSHPNNGLIALFRNPNDKNFWILILAGIGSLGTQSTIFAIVSNHREIISEGSEFVTILQGESQDGIHISGVKKVMSTSVHSNE